MIKKYNEHFSDAKKEAILNYSQEILSTLIDNNFMVKSATPFSKAINITKQSSKLYKSHLDVRIIEFKWDEVKDEVIKFLQIVEDEYEISNSIKFTRRLGTGLPTISYIDKDDVINEIDIPDMILSVSIIFI